MEAGAPNEQVGQHINSATGFQLALHLDRHAFTALILGDVQGATGFSVIGAAMNDVIAPDMVSIFRPDAGAGPIIQPKPPLLSRSFSF